MYLPFMKVQRRGYSTIKKIVYIHSPVQRWYETYHSLYPVFVRPRLRPSGRTRTRSGTTETHTQEGT